MNGYGFIITSTGILVVRGSAEALAALGETTRSIADDIANLWQRYDDSKSLAEGVQSLINGDGTKLYEVVGSAAFATGLAAGMALAWPALAATAGGAAVIVAGGWLAGKLYEDAFEQANQAGKWWAENLPPFNPFDGERDPGPSHSNVICSPEYANEVHPPK